MGVWTDRKLTSFLLLFLLPNPLTYVPVQWFRQHGYLHDGKYASLEDFLRAEWEGGFLDWDANDLLTLLHTWQSGDVSDSLGGAQFADILAGLKPKGLIMPCKTDLYFPVSARCRSRCILDRC